MLKEYLFNVALALDRFIMTLFGGHHLDTISGQLGKREVDGCKCSCLLCKILSFVFRDENHCVKAYRAERLLKHKHGLREPDDKVSP